MVNIRPLALPVGAVAAVVAVDGSALVKVNVVVLQRFNQNLHSPGNLPLGIGVLHAKEQYAARPVGHPLGDHALYQVAQVDEACGRGGHAGHDGPFRQVPLGESRLQLLGGGGYIGKQKISQCLIIHKIYLFVIKI